MRHINSGKIRSMFLLGGVGAMLGVTMMAAPAAHADKSKNYKYGAAALGILGAVLVAKGKTVPGAIAGAAGYYAYEKGRKIQKQDQRNDRHHWSWRKDRHSRNYDWRGRNHRYDNNRRHDWRKDNNYNRRHDYGRYGNNRHSKYGSRYNYGRNRSDHRWDKKDHYSRDSRHRSKYFSHYDKRNRGRQDRHGRHHSYSVR